MATQIKLGDIAVDVVLKDIKNINLSVSSPMGRVRISAPSRMNIDNIRAFAISKLGWIKQQQQKLQRQERETPREYLDRESHYVWGRRYLLKVIEDHATPEVKLKHSEMILRVRPGTEVELRRAIVSLWYREQIKATVPGLIAKWERMMHVKVDRVFVQKMKTKWGSCNPANRSIRLNTDLAKKPHECLEYVLVHEMVHLLERHHNERFKESLDRLMPQWHQYREALNRSPLAHENWVY